MSKRTLTVSFLTAGLTVGVIAGAVGPAAAQGNPVGGSGNVYYLAGAGNTGGTAQQVLAFGDPGDEVFYGDWNNDGTDTPMVRRNGVFYVADKDGKTVDVFAYGNPGDKVIVGDWDDKNGDSLAVVRTEQGTNHFFVKNDVKTTGKADSEYFYGNAGDNILVGDWDGDGKDTLMVARPDTSFHVRNSSGGGVEDYAFTYGNPGDTILVGDWADPANGKSGNGADQIAVRRDGNHYFFSKELGKGADIGTAMRDQLYGEATDTVFAAALPSVELDKDGKPYPNNQRPKTYAADTGAVYAGGETVLNTDTGAVVLDQVSSKPLTYKAGDPKLRIKGEKQVYRGGEVKLGVNGKPVVYVANGTVTTDPNEQALPSADGKVPLYLSGEVRLNADGSQKRTITAGSSTVDVWDGTEISDLPAAQREYTAKVGDPVLRRAGEQMVQSPLVQKTWTAADDVVLNESTDVILNPDGTPALNAGAYQYHNGQVTKKEADGVTVVKHKDGDPVTRRAGEIVKGYQWSGTAWTGPTAIPNDEATGWYLTRNPGTTAPTADNKKVADLDNDLDVEPVWYKGTEPIFGDGTTSLPNYLGGEAVAGNKAGDVVRDKDGNVIMVNTSIKGDGLGVRRNFG